MDSTSPENHSTSRKKYSINPDETAKFDAISDQWWDPNGSFAPLHALNPIRLEILTRHLRQHFNRNSSNPFNDLRVLDIGCGGGLASEPMARLGGIVTGVDALETNINVAQNHAAQTGLNIHYRTGTVEELLAENTPPFNIILNLEVVEHVANPQSFLQDCAKLLAPGGCMAISSINRTAKAFLLAILGAEYLLRWLPRGTHQFSRLVQPDEVANALAGLKISTPVGMAYNLLHARWTQSHDTQVNYMLFAAAPELTP